MTQLHQYLNSPKHFSMANPTTTKYHRDSKDNLTPTDNYRRINTHFYNIFMIDLTALKSVGTHVCKQLRNNHKEWDKRREWQTSAAQVKCLHRSTAPGWWMTPAWGGLAATEKSTKINGYQATTVHDKRTPLTLSNPLWGMNTGKSF